MHREPMSLLRGWKHAGTAQLSSTPCGSPDLSCPLPCMPSMQLEVQHTDAPLGSTLPYSPVFYPPAVTCLTYSPLPSSLPPLLFFSLYAVNCLTSPPLPSHPACSQAPDLPESSAPPPVLRPARHRQDDDGSGHRAADLWPLDAQHGSGAQRVR